MYTMTYPNAMSQTLVPGPYTMMPPNIPHVPIVGGYNNSPQMAFQLPAHHPYCPPPPANQGLLMPITPQHDAALLDSYQSFDKFMESKADSASKTVPNTPNVPFPPYHFGTTLSPTSMAIMNQRGPDYHPTHGMQPPHTARPSFGVLDGAPAGVDCNVKSSSVSSVTNSQPKNIKTTLINSQAQHDRDLRAMAALPEHERMAIKGPIEMLHLAAELKRTHRENERSIALDNFGDAAKKEEHHDSMMLRYHEQVIKYLIRYVTAVLPDDASDEQKKEYDMEKTLHIQKATNAMHHAFQHQLAGSKFRKDTEQHRAVVVKCEQDMKEVETELNNETWKLIHEVLCGREEGLESETASSVKTGNGPQKGNGSQKSTDSQHGNGPQNRIGAQSGRGGANRNMSTDPSNTQKNGNSKAKNTNVSEGEKPHLNAGNRDQNGNVSSDGNGGQNGKGHARKWKKNHKKTPSVTTDVSKATDISKSEPKVEPKIEPTPAEAAKLGNGKADRGNVNKIENDSLNSRKPSTIAGPQNSNKTSNNGATLDNTIDSQITKADSTNGSPAETSGKKKMGTNTPNAPNQNHKNKNQKKTASATTDTSKTDEPKIDIKKLERPKTAAPKTAANIEDAGGKMKVIDPDSYARQV
jgi:hypothetical protein